MNGLRKRAKWAVLACLGLVAAMGQGCGLSKEAQARQDDWMGRAKNAAQTWREGKGEESAEILGGLWEQKGRSPQPEGGIPPRAFNLDTTIVLTDEKAKAVLEPRLRGQMSELEQRVTAGEADEHQTEVWYDLAGVLRDTDSVVRVVEAGRGNRKVICPLLSPREQRREIQRALEKSGHAETAKVLDLTTGESVSEGFGDLLWFTGRLSPALMTMY